MILVIEGETPSKKNAKKFNTKTRCVYTNKHFQQWHTSAQLQVNVQATSLKEEYNFPINQPCRINLTFIHGDNVRRDSDNGTSSILDLLQDCGVLEDDNWKIVRELNIKNDYLKGKPSCKVEIVLL